MHNHKYWGLLLILTFVIVACTPQEMTPTLAPTQTPFILVVTATPSYTPIPSQTLTTTPTLTAQPTVNILDRCVLRTDWYHYQVEVGDTLSNLAVRTDSTVTVLQLANCIADINRIQVGQMLYLPRRPNVNEPIVEDLISDFSANISEVRAGDTIVFSWVAEAGTVIEIRYVNGNNIFIGSNLAATGSLSYILPANLGNLTKLEFVIRGSNVSENEEILASPYSIFIDVVSEPEVTEEADVTEEPEATEVPDITEESEMTEEAND